MDILRLVNKHGGVGGPVEAGAEFFLQFNQLGILIRRNEQHLSAGENTDVAETDVEGLRFGGDFVKHLLQFLFPVCGIGLQGDVLGDVFGVLARQAHGIELLLDACQMVFGMVIIACHDA